jgi:hypothetical protein
MKGKNTCFPELRIFPLEEVRDYLIHYDYKSVSIGSTCLLIGFYDDCTSVPMYIYIIKYYCYVIGKTVKNKTFNDVSKPPKIPLADLYNGLTAAII